MCSMFATKAVLAVKMFSEHKLYRDVFIGCNNETLTLDVRSPSVRPFISMITAIKIYKGLIELHLHYCSAVWDGLTQQLSDKLQKTSKSCYQSYHQI